jgi:hypothetical protein
MKKRVVALVVLTAFGLVSCSGSTGGDYAPPAEVPNAQGAPQPQDLGSALPQQQAQSVDIAPPENAPAEPSSDVPQVATPPVATPVRQLLPQAVVTPSPSCSTQRLPGSYISIVAPGRMTGATFTPTVGAAVWQRLRYVASSSTPKPRPKSSTSTAPQRGFVYSGTYTVKRSGSVDTVGCVTLTTATSGTNFKAQPKFAKPVRTTMIGSGSVSKLAITRLSATGGSGSFLLSNGLSGTIKLTARQRTP